MTTDNKFLAFLTSGVFNLFGALFGLLKIVMHYTCSQGWRDSFKILYRSLTFHRNLTIDMLINNRRSLFLVEIRLWKSCSNYRFYIIWCFGTLSLHDLWGLKQIPSHFFLIDWTPGKLLRISRKDLFRKSCANSWNISKYFDFH